MPGRTKIFFDGGCRPNPGRMEIAVVAGGRVHIERDLGFGTSMDAEWLGLLQGLRIALAGDFGDVILLGDAIAVIDQVNGRVKCRGAGVGHLETFRALAAGADTPPVRYIKRTQNLAGIALARSHDR